MLTYTHEFTTNREELKHHEGQPYTALSITDRPDDAHKVEHLPLHRIRFADGTEIDAISEEVLPNTGDVECAMVIERRYGDYRDKTRAWVLLRDLNGLAAATPFDSAGEALNRITRDGRWGLSSISDRVDGLNEFWGIYNSYERGEDKFDSDLLEVRTPHLEGVFPYLNWIDWE